jgi:hypothetical protein
VFFVVALLRCLFLYYRSYDVNSFNPLSTSFFPHCCYNAKNARVLRVFRLKKVFRKMPKSLDNGPSKALRFRAPAALERRIKANLRPGETLSDVARRLLEQWAARRERAK